MSEFNLISIEQIQRDDDLPELPLKMHDSIGGAPSGVKYSMSLQEIKSRIDTLFIPRYLPGGFNLVQSFARVEDGKGSVVLGYVKERGRLYDRINIFQFCSPGHLKLKKGYYKKILVKTYPGCLIDGGWAARRSESGKILRKWETGYETGLVFERGTTWSLLRIRHPGPFLNDDKPEITKIAESMELY